MKIAILSRNPKLYSTKRLVEAGTARGHEVRVINTLRCYMNIASSKPEVHYNGENIGDFDAEIPPYRCLYHLLRLRRVARV